MSEVLAGWLTPLVDEISNAADVLGCTAALQVVTDLAQQLGPAATQLLGSRLLPVLAQLMSQADDELLRDGALKV